MNEPVEDAITTDDIDDTSASVDMPEVESDSSPAPEANQEEKNKNGIQERFNTLTAEKYQEKRRADALEAELQRIKAEKAAIPETPTPSVAAPVLPEVPDDLYDPEVKAKYQSDMQKYNQQLLDYNKSIAENTAKGVWENQQRQVQEAERQAKTQQVVSKFVTNAIRDGVDTDKLRVAEETLVNSGITPELGGYIMNDPNGGKIAEFLYDNPALMHEVLSLDPVSAGIKIANEVKPQALSKTPKVTKAPDPLPEIHGGGVVDKDDFDRQFPGTEFI